MSAEFRSPGAPKTTRDAGEVQISLSGDLRKICFAKIRRVTTGSMELITPLFIGPSQTIEIVYLECRVECRVIRCVELTGDNHVVTVRLLRCAGVDMRAEPRVPILLNGTLQTFGSAERHAVRVLDISQSGLGIAVPIALTAGQQVSLDIGRGIAIGEVRYCRVTSDGYRAGLLVLEFLDREILVRGESRPASAGSRTRMDGILSLIRDRRSDLLAPPNGEAEES